ncbi:MAG: hypothetical protein J7L66_04235, partial [Anaerolineaceae bacterium]|nr:hypothetical protein [Anaerolineaceae bacterium]
MHRAISSLRGRSDKGATNCLVFQEVGQSGLISAKQGGTAVYPVPCGRVLCYIATFFRRIY